MYLEYYGFEREPFHITPDPEFLFLSPSHKEAFATVVYGVEQRKGFVALTGEVGTGKTTVLRAYLKRIERSPTRPIYLFNPDLTFDELLRVILREMGDEAKGDTAQSMLDRLQWLLVNEYKENHNVVLIIDEAQNMPVETLEKLRMLSNLETAKDKLIQIVLVGQPELQERLEQHELRQLRQRIAVRAIIRSLTPAQSHDYIRYRLTQAGCLRERVFSKGALRSIVRRAKGNPRLLNILCDNSLVAGFGAMEESVSVKTVREVARDVLENPWKKSHLKWAVAVTAVVLVGGVSVVLASAGTANSEVSRTQEPLQVAHVAAPVPPKVAVPEVTPAEVTSAPEAVLATEVVPISSTEAVAAAPELSATASAQTEAPMLPSEPVSVPEPRIELETPVEPPPVKTLDHKDIALRKMNELMSRAEQTAPASTISPEGTPTVPAAITPAEPVSEPAVVSVDPASPVAPPDAAPVPTPRPVAVEHERDVDVPPAVPDTRPDSASTSSAVTTSAEASASAAVPGPEFQVAAVRPSLLPAVIAEAVSPPVPVVEEVREAPPEPDSAIDGNDPKAPESQVIVPQAVVNAATENAASAETIRLLPRYVHQGDCLTRLVAEVYGRSTPSLVETVRRYNPHVLNADIIWHGDTLVFPERIVDERGAVQTASIPGDAPPGE